MSKSIEFDQLRKGDARIAQVTQLYRQFYDGMSNVGLLLPLAVDGEYQWMTAVEMALGRFHHIALAIDSDKVVGFVHGAARFVPDYLGGKPEGFVSALYVSPEHRRLGLGLKLYMQLEAWFQQKNVQSISLQVLCGNANAQEFWKATGFQPELVQMRKI